MYTVNGFYKHHVTVLAEVVAVAVELSTTKLVLKPGLGMPVEAGELHKESDLKLFWFKKQTFTIFFVYGIIALTDEILHTANDAILPQDY